MDRTEKLSIEQKSYRYNRKAIKRTEKLPIEQKSYQKNRKAIDRTYIYKNRIKPNFCRENAQLRHFYRKNL